MRIISRIICVILLFVDVAAAQQTLDPRVIPSNIPRSIGVDGTLVPPGALLDWQLNFQDTAEINVTNPSAQNLQFSIVAGSIADSKIASITTRGKLPVSIAYEDEANTWASTNTFNGAMSIGGTGSFSISGSTSGVITLGRAAAAGTYNFNLPTSAGTAGQPLLSGGGGANPMTFGTLGFSGGGTGNTTYTAARCVRINDSGTNFESAAGDCGTGTGTNLILVNPQTGTTYTVQNGDNSSLVTLSNTSAVAVTLPNAAGTGFDAGWHVYVKNIGTGRATITPVTSTIDGLTTLVLEREQWALIVSNGTNYFSNRGGDVKPTNAQTGTTYTVLNGDQANLITFSNASAVAVTLPNAAGAGFDKGWYAFLKNIGAGTVTVTPTTSSIDGGASLALLTGQWTLVVSDGTNYFSARGGIVNLAADVTGVLAAANVGNLPASKITSGILALAQGGTNQATWTASRCVRVNAGGTGLESAAADCGGAPPTAGYWTSAADATLTNEQNVGALTAGILKHSGGIPATAVAGTDYVTPTGSGAGLTNLNASNLASGNVPLARNTTSVVDGSAAYCASATTIDAYACNLPSAPTSYVTGGFYSFKADVANTGVSSINFNSLGARAIKRWSGGSLVDTTTGDIGAGQVVELQYDGTNMIAMSLGGGGGGGVAGSGTANKGTIWVDTETVGDSAFYSESASNPQFGDVSTNYLIETYANITGAKTRTKLNVTGVEGVVCGSTTAGHYATFDSAGCLTDGGTTTSPVRAFWDAGALTLATASTCTAPALVQIGSGPSLYITTCTNASTSTFEGSLTLAQAVTTVDFTLTVNDVDSAGQHFAGDFSVQCRGNGTAPNTTWGTSQSVDITMTTANTNYTGTTTAVSPNGSCGAGATLFWRWVRNTSFTDGGNARVLGVLMRQVS